MDIFKDIADPEVNGKIDGPDLTKLREAYNEFETAYEGLFCPGQAMSGGGDMSEDRAARIHKIAALLPKLQAEHARINQQMIKLETERAELLCPYRIGDIIINSDTKQKAEIVRIKPGGVVEYKMYGYIFKKDGSYGKRVVELWDDGWRAK